MWHLLEQSPFWGCNLSVIRIIIMYLPAYKSHSVICLETVLQGEHKGLAYPLTGHQGVKCRSKDHVTATEVWVVPV